MRLLNSDIDITITIIIDTTLEATMLYVSTEAKPGGGLNP